MDSSLASALGVRSAAASLLDHSLVSGEGGGGRNSLGGFSLNNAAGSGGAAAGIFLLNATMKLDSDLATVCSNASGAVGGGGGDGGGSGAGGDGSGVGGEACDRKAMGISLSTPILMMSTGVLGNLLALLVLLTTDRKVRRAPFFPLLMAMACTDLVGQVATGVIAIITYANDLKWVGGRPVCLYHGFVMVFLAVITPLLVCSMSVERLLALKFSYFYQRNFTNRLAKGIIVGSLAFTLFFSTWPLMGFGSYELQFPGSWCFLNYHRETVKDMIFALIFAGINIAIIAFIIISNGIVVWTLLKMRRVRHQLRSSPSVEGVNSVVKKKPKSRSSALHLEMETQMVWFLMAITVVFSCLWLPINVHIVINQITGKTNYKQDLITVRLASINQIIDPWMYIIFRKGTFFKCLRRIKRLISRSKASCGVYSSAERPSSNRLSLMKRLPGQQSCPPAVGSSSASAKDQALDLLLPAARAANSHALIDASPSDLEIELSLNGPLYVIEGPGCGLNGPLRVIKEASHDDLEAACRGAAERDTSLCESSGQGHLIMSFCEDECNKDSGCGSIVREEDHRQRQVERDTDLSRQGSRGSTSESGFQDDGAWESVSEDKRHAAPNSQRQPISSTEKTRCSRKERNAGSRNVVETCLGVMTAIPQDKCRQQTNDSACTSCGETTTDTLVEGDGGVEEFREAGKGQTIGSLETKDCTGRHSQSENKDRLRAWEVTTQSCSHSGVSRNTNVSNDKQLKSSPPQNGRVVSIPNNDLNLSGSKKQHLWK